LKGIAEVRDSKDIKSRFCIVDGKEVTFMILNDDKVHPTYDVGVWLNTPFFAQSLQALFDSNWNSMSQLK